MGKGVARVNILVVGINNTSYNTDMKTSISLDDDLLTEADAAARELGVSRSKLLTQALAEHLRKLSDEKLTEQLNRAYPEGEPQESMASLKPLYRRALADDRW